MFQTPKIDFEASKYIDMIFWHDVEVIESYFHIYSYTVLFANTLYLKSCDLQRLVELRF